jgi:two-component system sensor histidine kinase RegB
MLRSPEAAGLEPGRRHAADPTRRSNPMTDRRRGAADATGRQNMEQLIELRWIAVLGQVATISLVHYGLEIPLPLGGMLTIALGLAAFNALSLLHLHLVREVSNAQLFVAMLVDVGMLTAQLYMSGGASNPFVFLYLLQVILGAVLLEAWSTWVIVAVAAACFAGLAIVGKPLALPPDHERGLGSLYIKGMLICFVLNASLLVIFVTRISHNLRARDERLADLRQRAAEEEHIVRMGLLASGAAHELGTPLSTLAVIMADWRRMKPFTSDPELMQEIGEMQTQVQRCKSIVSGILMSAGEARGEAPMQTTVHTFLDDLVTEWRATRPVNEFSYENRFGQDLAIISDSAIKQMVHNVLDNALEASLSWVHLDVMREDDALVLLVRDDGLGFEPEMLERLGKPYQSSKGRPGGGLGLFLVVNVARTLGGTVAARNRPEGGAEVTLTLPLSAITLEDRHHASNGN